MVEKTDAVGDEYFAYLREKLFPKTADWNAWGGRVRSWIGRLPDLQLSDVQIWVDAELERREIAKAMAEKRTAEAKETSEGAAI